MSGLAHGQEPQTIRAKFRILSVNDEISSLSIVGASETQEVMIPELRRSDIYRYEGPQVLSFIKTDQIVEGEPLPAPVMQVRGVSKHKNALILVFRIESSVGTRFQSIVMSDDIDGFPGGTSRFVNISSYPLLLLFEEGEEPQKLASGGIFSHAFKTENQNVHIRIASYADGEVHKGLDDRIFPKPIHRDIYFIFEENDGENGRVKMRRLREHRNAAIHLYRSDG
ncbi:MAG: hypothetical protein ISQ75_06510 [Puniceicoccaceae bacterium]|jgi:hypothetical protein|nr:hypothetical protein [Puniceicoccaceae bacterium]